MILIDVVLCVGIVASIEYIGLINHTLLMGLLYGLFVCLH